MENDPRTYDIYGNVVDDPSVPKPSIGYGTKQQATDSGSLNKWYANVISETNGVTPKHLQEVMQRRGFTQADLDEAKNYFANYKANPYYKSREDEFNDLATSGQVVGRSQSEEEFLDKYKQWIDKDGKFAGDRANGSEGIGSDAYLKANGVENSLNGKDARQFYRDAIAGGANSADANYYHKKGFVEGGGLERMATAAAKGAAIMYGASSLMAPAMAGATAGASTGGWSMEGALSSMGSNALKSAAVQLVRTGKVDPASALKGAVIGEIAGGIGGSVGGWAKEAGASDFISKAVGSAAGGAAVAGITGRNVGDSIINSLENSAIGNFVGDPLKKYTGSETVGNIGNDIVNSALHGKTPDYGGIIANQITNGVLKFSNPYVKQATDGIKTSVNDATDNLFAYSGWSKP